jgi:hypothetical protein
MAPGMPLSPPDIEDNQQLKKSSLTTDDQNGTDPEKSIDRNNVPKDALPLRCAWSKAPRISKQVCVACRNANNFLQACQVFCNVSNNVPNVSSDSVDCRMFKLSLVLVISTNIASPLLPGSIRHVSVSVVPSDRLNATKLPESPTLADAGNNV